MACNKIMVTRNNTNRQQMILASPPQLKLVEVIRTVLFSEVSLNELQLQVLMAGGIFNLSTQNRRL